MVTPRLPRVGAEPELLGAGSCLGGALLKVDHSGALTHQVSDSSIIATAVWGPLQL